MSLRLRNLILAFSSGLFLIVILIFISAKPVHAIAQDPDITGRCSDMDMWGINTSGDPRNPGGLIVKTIRSDTGAKINVSFTISTRDTGGSDIAGYGVGEYSHDGWGRIVWPFHQSATFSTGSTIDCGAWTNSFTGYAVFGFGGSASFGNYWALACKEVTHEDSTVYNNNDEEYRITNLPSSVGGVSGTWSGTGVGNDLVMSNGSTLLITLVFTPTPPPPTPTPTPIPPPTCTLTLQPIAIQRGESSTLSWTTSNATSASLGGTAVGLTGSTGVSPPETTTYIMNVSGPSGSSDCQITLLVAEPLTCSLAVDPQLFPAGTTSRLSWTTTGANGASIDQGIGGAELPSGSRNITPLTTTTYTMTATSSIGRTTTCFVVAHVLPACTLSILPLAIKPGGTALLSWTTVNAQSGSIEPQVGDITNQLASGTRSVSATVDTTFRLTVVNSEGSYVCEVTLHMLPVCDINAQPQAILRGQSSLLSWTTIFTQSASIDNGVGDVSSLLPVGSFSVSPRKTTTYTMTASNPWGDSTCFATVDIIFSALISPARGTICDFVVLTLKVLGVTAFVIALLLFLFAGLRWIASRGDEKTIAQARSMMLSTGVGLTILVSAVSIILLIEYFFQVTIFQCPAF